MERRAGGRGKGRGGQGGWVAARVGVGTGAGALKRAGEWNGVKRERKLAACTPDYILALDTHLTRTDATAPILSLMRLL